MSEGLFASVLALDFQDVLDEKSEVIFLNLLQ